MIGDLIVSTPQNVQGTYNHVLVTGPTTGGAGVATLTGPLTVMAGLTVQDGGTLVTSCQPLSGPGTFTLASGATLGICDAAGISITGPTGAVQLAGTRSFSPDASYVYNGLGPQLTGSGLPSQARNLTTTNANDVTLTSPLTVAQVVTVGGTGDLVLNGLPFTLPSGPGGTALVVNVGSGVVRGTTGTMQRYLDPSTNPGRGYRHYSSPVAGSTVASLATPGFAPEISQANAYNVSATPGTITPFPTVFGYDQSRLATISSAYSAFDKGFFVPTALATPLAVGRGYAVNISAAEVVSFTGQFTTGDQVLALDRNTTTTAEADEAGWHLVGNPYPAPLDFALFDSADRLNLDASCYVVESAGPYAGAYRAYINGVGGSSLIGSSQGFFVRVSEGQTSGMLTFHNRQRLTSFGPQVAVRRTTADTRPLVQLELQAPTGTTDNFYAYAEAGATVGFDAQYDARKLSNSTGLNLASTTGAGARLAIDGRPAFAATTVLPLTIDVPAAGNYTLTASTLRNLPLGLSAYLTDAATGQTINLSRKPTYSFTVTASQASALLVERFSLRFGLVGTLANSTATPAAEIELYPNPAHGSFTVGLPPGLGTTVAQVELLNNMGQVVHRQAVHLSAGGTRFVMTTTGLATGIYSLRLQSGTTLVRRVVLE
ncbi:T9SS type A sorting domain-containing protein [Hymenobacter sp. BRD67]|uniref:T9SS type A sorting domain-containing protein n=1 Tax=Hymenobacter sp. BRD67 TaxID=2675877 RepID=UPI001567B205|nr:T9SS type A sorting domain-containing protein [Hymenobacter sp. BRD67]QKG51853.1 T9SS type A sorting domain-containing protein [Hymenobacter sp. BRD67]